MVKILRKWGLPMVFLIAFISPVTQLSDSHFTFYTSSRLISSGAPYLDDLITNFRGDLCGVWTCDGGTGLPYHLTVGRGHYVYYFPHGSAVMAMPLAYVAGLAGLNAESDGGGRFTQYFSPLVLGLLDLTGASDKEKARARSILNQAEPRGSYRVVHELVLQRLIAAGFAALFVYFALRLARLWLDEPTAWGVSLVFVFGTLVGSTLSRAYWADTPAVVLMTAALWLSCRPATAGRLVIVATLCAWSYFAKPTYAIPILAVVAVVVLRSGPRVVPVLALVGAAWLALFVAYWHAVFGAFLPPYFDPGRLDGHARFWEALAGNLVSPARGLLVFSPFVGVALVALILYWKSLPDKALAGIALAAFAAVLLTVSSFPHWWGGHSFGPRLLASAIPFVLLLSILALSAARTSGQRPVSKKVLSVIALIATAASIAVNTSGMFSYATASWNVEHAIDTNPEALWDWRHPQFLSAFLEREDNPIPKTLP